MKSILTKSIYYFINEQTGELNKRGIILAGILLITFASFVGFLDQGGLLPWE